MRHEAGLVVVALAASCAPRPVARPERAAPVAAPHAEPLRRARYFVLAPTPVERAGERVRAIAGGRRVELAGLAIAAVSAEDARLDGGARAPAWAAGPARYAFWRGADVFTAGSFLGSLRSLASLRSEPSFAFEWLDGTGLALHGGAVVVPSSGGAPHAIGVAALVRGIAAEGRRALATTALGHAWVTLDGGGSYRDASAAFGGALRLERRGELLVARLPDGRERGLAPTGAVVEDVPARGAVVEGAVDPFLAATGVEPLEAAVEGGLPLDDGGIVIAAHGHVARLDAATLRTTSLAALPPGLDDATCAPARADGEIVLACVGPTRAAVVDLDGAPRLERTFDLAGATELQRFVAGEDAIGFLGPCDGSPPRAPDVEPGPYGEPDNASRERSPVFCVRAGRDAWVEHRLGADEAPDVIAWVPRRGGGAVAILAVARAFLDAGERVATRGPLRVVRIPRAEPPLALATSDDDGGGAIVDRSFRVLADDTITGWLAAGSSGVNETAIAIDAAGRVRAHAPPPEATRIAHAGLLALAAADDGRLWETSDGGRRWVLIPGPPLGAGGAPFVTSCSPAGCALEGIARLGWSGAGDDARELPPDAPGSRARSYEVRRARPVLELACTAEAPPEGRRMPDSGAFGYTPKPAPRAALVRLGTLGFAAIPWARRGVAVASGDAELAWLPPLAPAASLVRRTLPVARLGLPPDGRRPRDQRLGWLLARDGGVSVFAAGGEHGCSATMLEAAGVTRPLGACAEGPAVGVEVGGRVVVLHAASASLEVSVAADAPTNGERAAHARPGSAGALRLVRATGVGGSTQGFSFGIGEREGAPVAVVLDVEGAAALAPIDPERGTLGPEERLASLRSAELGSSPACAAHAGEARVVLPFDAAVGLAPGSLPGVLPGFGGGVAVIRWSGARACIDAIEIPVEDDRFEDSPGPHDPSGTVRKIVARFDRAAQAALVVVAPGTEIRQRLACTRLVAAEGT